MRFFDVIWPSPSAQPSVDSTSVANAITFADVFPWIILGIAAVTVMAIVLVILFKRKK